MDFEAKATIESFNKIYEENTKTCETYRGAYELTEIDHTIKFGKRRYSDYKSFEQSRRHFLTKL